MTFPGAGRAVLIGGSLGGGTGRTTDWSTYDGNNDTAWQQWIKDDSTALGTTYQTIKGFKNTALASSGSAYIGVDNNGTQGIAKFVPDTDDATAGHFTLGSFHDLGTNRVQMLNNGVEMVLTSATDSGTIVVVNQQLQDSGKVSGLVTNLVDNDWDAVLVNTTTSNGGTGAFHSPADLIMWTSSPNGITGMSGNRAGFAWQLWLKGTYTGPSGNSSGRDGVNELITTGSQQPYYTQNSISQNHLYGDMLDSDGFDDHVPHIHWMRNHLESDTGRPDNSSDEMHNTRQTERFFLSQKMFESSGTHHDADETTNVFKMMLFDHYANNGSGGHGGNGGTTLLHPENSYRSNSDVKYFKVTGRSTNNINNDNTASMIKGNSMIQVYNDESGTLGGNIYVTAITDVTSESASSQVNPTTHDNGVANMFRFAEVTSDNTHSTFAKKISENPNADDSTNTSYDPEALCIGDLHGDYFGVAWRQGTTAYVSIFEITEPDSSSTNNPQLTIVADTINLGTVPNAGRMALAKLGAGVAVLTCGNYYRIIKTDTI